MTGGWRFVGWMCAGMLVVALGSRVGLVVVGGRSMQPALYPGDVCLFVRGQSPRVGDVVLIDQPVNRDVLHRVELVREGGVCRTRGDANAVSDRELRRIEDLRGTVRFTLPLGKGAYGWMQAVRGATLLNQSHTRR